jgi:hypothetical protein
MVELVKGNSRLAGEIDQRKHEDCQRGNKQDRNAVFVRHATEPSRKAGAATLPIMLDSCSIEGVSSGMLFTQQNRKRYWSRVTVAAMSGTRLIL